MSNHILCRTIRANINVTVWSTLLSNEYPVLYVTSLFVVLHISGRQDILLAAYITSDDVTETRANS